MTRDPRRRREVGGRGGSGGSAPRVVLASRIYLPEPGAASFRLDNLSQAVVRGGGSVTVLTTTVPHYPDVVRRPGVRVSRWPARRDAHGYIRGYVEYLSFDIPLLLRLLARRDAEVLICEPPPTTGAVMRIASRILGVPYVYYAGDVWSQALKTVAPPRPVLALLTQLECWAMQGAAAVLTVSPAFAQAIERMGVRSPVHMVGNGVDTEVFSPDGDVAGLPGDYFVYTGTASEVHGATIFLDAFEKVLATHPGARVAFIGQGTDFALIEERARSMPPGAVVVLPRQSPETTATWIRGARAALASVRPGAYGFAFPSKAMAAAACGIPVIMASPEETRRPIVDGDLGWAVDFDVDQVAAAMVAALETPLDAAAKERRADWVARTSSLRSCGDRGAAVVLALAREGRSSDTETPEGPQRADG